MWPFNNRNQPQSTERTPQPIDDLTDSRAPTPEQTGVVEIDDPVLQLAIRELLDAHARDPQSADRVSHFRLWSKIFMLNGRHLVVENTFEDVDRAMSLRTEGLR